jgi:WD40 repeat protein
MSSHMPPSTAPGGSSSSLPSASETPGNAAAAADSKPPQPTDQAVLEYLRSKGLYQAALELSERIQPTSHQGIRDKMEQEDEESRAQRSLLTKATGGGFGYERDDVWHVVKWGVPDTAAAKIPVKKDPKSIGAIEAQAYLDAFTAIQLWVLTLPDHEGSQTIENPIARAQALMESKEASLETVLHELTKTNEASSASSSSPDAGGENIHYNLPPSAKHELLSVTFALLVYTYSELLEVGMESTAHVLRDAFQSLYEPLYPTELRDLYHCTSTDDMMRLNSYNTSHMEAVASLKAILVQVATCQLRREEYHAQQSMGVSSSRDTEAKIREYDRNIGILKSKYGDMSERASRIYDKMHDWPFLRRARAARWQLTLSTQSYALLTAFLQDDALLPMSTLLQIKCVVTIQSRPPLPFTPSCVLEQKTDPKSKGKKCSVASINEVAVRWASPAWQPENDEAGSKLPFPKFNLAEEYETEDQAKRDKKIVEFNRALLKNGFRRLEALERKRTYESSSTAAQKRMREGEDTIVRADPLVHTSILLTTLCSSASGPVLRPPSSSNRNILTDVNSIWEEPGVSLTCAKLCAPDGKRVAVGCDDAAVRIWHLDSQDTTAEPSQVLLGHKNGMPVFDVDWNRDGRTLLSAGGDGSIRLWDTLAVGPFGELTTPKDTATVEKLGTGKSTNNESIASLKEALKADTREPVMNVPGLKAETSPYTNGSALAVYRGHAPSTPVWAVAFSPAGYYFASAGGDGTARLWTTDRPTPVRLFTGHTAANVNCVVWHPNANYILTGSDDKTVRLWDIQTGRTVRLLTGCAGGIDKVAISPGGRYAVASDQTGSVHVWDLSSGKKLSEFRTPSQRGASQHPVEPATIHSLAFSPCGNALATGGDDAVVRIWDIRKESLVKETKAQVSPTKSFATRQTMLLDLQYTSRNLLLAAGKFLAPIQTIPN